MNFSLKYNFMILELKTWVQVPALPLAKNVICDYTPKFSELHLKIKIIAILPTL